jgi:putative transposase
MNPKLKRYYGAGDLHFITCSCYRRQPLLEMAKRRDLFLTVLGRRNPAQVCLLNHAPQHIWQKRFYDFNVWTEHKRIEKLRYMHRNPVNRGLVASPELWRCSAPTS